MKMFGENPDSLFLAMPCGETKIAADDSDSRSVERENLNNDGGISSDSPEIQSGSDSNLDHSEKGIAELSINTQSNQKDVENLKPDESRIESQYIQATDK